MFYFGGFGIAVPRPLVSASLSFVARFFWLLYVMLKKKKSDAGSTFAFLALAISFRGECHEVTASFLPWPAKISKLAKLVMEMREQGVASAASP